MSGQAAELRSFIKEAFADDDALSVFAAPLRPFLGKRSEIDSSFNQMAKKLGKARSMGVVQLSITKGRRSIQRCIVMSPTGCEAVNTRVDHPNLELITDVKTWAEIARGEVGPLEAFGSGRLRVRGDIRLAKLVARRLR